MSWHGSNGQIIYIEVEQVNHADRSLGQQFGLALRRTIMTELSKEAETMTTLPRFGLLHETLSDLSITSSLRLFLLDKPIACMRKELRQASFGRPNLLYPLPRLR